MPVTVSDLQDHFAV